MHCAILITVPQPSISAACSVSLATAIWSGLSTNKDKYFVGAYKREGGKEAGRERDKTSFSFSSKLDNYVTEVKILWD